jgi:hypothetical protein
VVLLVVDVAVVVDSAVWVDALSGRGGGRERVGIADVVVTAVEEGAVDAAVGERMGVDEGLVSGSLLLSPVEAWLLASSPPPALAVVLFPPPPPHGRHETNFPIIFPGALDALLSLSPSPSSL